ncbi:MAG TPA: CBS domain-containing protein [Conexibacter sp.]|jgi:CBS domain-containing protein|nr:CBS domain-containing protein [Conexibacter sp.]
MATVADIMERDPVTVSPEDSVETLLRTLRERELPGVPVVNGGGRCIGIVTESDLVLVDEEEDLRLPLHIDLFGGTIFLGRLKPFEDRVKKAIASTVADMMTADPLTVAPDTDVHDAARLIAEHRHNRLPVVEHGRLVGVVTRLDVLEALVS